MTSPFYSFPLTVDCTFTFNHTHDAAHPATSTFQFPQVVLFRTSHAQNSVWMSPRSPNSYDHFLSENVGLLVPSAKLFYSKLPFMDANVASER